MKSKKIFNWGLAIAFLLIFTAVALTFFCPKSPWIKNLGIFSPAIFIGFSLTAFINWGINRVIKKLRGAR